MNKHNISDPDYEKVVRKLNLRFEYLMLNNKDIKHKNEIKNKYFKFIKILSEFYDDKMDIVEWQLY